MCGSFIQRSAFPCGLGEECIADRGGAEGDEGWVDVLGRCERYVEEAGHEGFVCWDGHHDCEGYPKQCDDIFDI